MDIRKLLYRLEEITDRFRIVRDAALMGTAVDEIIEDLDELYEDLQQYTDVVCGGGLDFLEKGETL